MKWILLALLPLVLAGCAESSDDREPRGDPASDASLAYRGNEAGTHSEEAFCEDGTANLVGVGIIDAGSLDVEVRDGHGARVHAQTHDDRWTGDARSLDGAGGNWVLEAERSGGFEGRYSLGLVCS